MKLIKIDLLLAGFILLLSFLTWGHIPYLQFTGEGWGFIGTLPPKGDFFEIIYQEFTPLNEYTFDRILSGILIPIFRDQIHLYMWFQLGFMLVIDLLIYILVRFLTGSRLAGFITAFLFSISYVGKYEMYSAGGYLYFAQRAVLLLPELISIIFLGLYLTKPNFFYFIISILLYLLGLVMSFFGAWFLPVFIIYPIIFFLFNIGEGKKLFWKVIWIPFPFIIGTMLIIKDRSVVSLPTESIFDFISNKFSIIFIGLVQQLTVLTFPMGELLLRFNKDQFEFFSILTITIFFYFYAFLANLKMHKDWKILQVTVLASTIVMFMINIYLQSAEVLHTFGSTRYFYYPAALISIFWGISFAGILKKQSFFTKKSLHIYFVVFLIFCFVYNNVLINRRLKDEEWVHKANKKTVEILRSWAPYTRQNPSYLYLPASLGGYGGQFAFQFYSHPKGDVAIEGLEVLDLDKLAKSGLSPENLYVLHFDPESKQVIDKTYEKRELLIKLQKK